MIFVKLKDANYEELKSAVIKKGGTQYETKTSCIEYLKSKQISVVESNKDKKINKKHKILNFNQNKSVNTKEHVQHTFNKVHCDDQTPPPPQYDPGNLELAYRKIPQKHTQDGVYGKLLVTHFLDVYHDIFYGPNKIKLSDQISYIETYLSNLQFSPYNGDVSTNTFVDSIAPYTPTVTFLSSDDQANIDHNYNHHLLQVQYASNKVDLKIDLRFHSINLSDDSDLQFKVNLPFEANIDYYTNNTKVPIPDVLISYDYDYILNEYKYKSKISLGYLDPINPQFLIIKSGLFQHQHETKYSDYYLSNSQFNVEIHFLYVARNINHVCN